MMIAAALGLRGKSGAYHMIERVHTRLLQETSEQATQLRALEDSRLDVLWEAIQAQALAGGLAAVMVALRLHDRKVRLHGLAAPSKVDVGLSPLMQAILEAWPDPPPPYIPVAPPALLPRGEGDTDWEEDEEGEG